MRKLIIGLCAIAPAIARADIKKLDVKSPAFTANGAIPTEYTCEGANQQPALEWGNVPAGTRTLAIIVEDPDAPKGIVTHWIVTNLPPSAMNVHNGSLPTGASMGTNEKGKAEYMGPCPPSGTHHYHFKVFALDTAMKANPTRTQLMAQMTGHVLAQGEIVGTYQKGSATRP